jgi:hypothetical protein
MSQSGQYGDGIVLACASRLYKRKITVILEDGHAIPLTTVDHCQAISDDAKSILIGFIRSGSDLANHYVHMMKKSISLLTNSGKCFIIAYLIII